MADELVRYNRIKFLYLTPNLSLFTDVKYNLDEMKLFFYKV